ncbi:MAG: hypothetical protein MUC83_00905 [Pirellula sp.]|nr:hypothetical protein [Pirellula sp.]
MRYFLLLVLAVGLVGCGADTSVKPAEKVTAASEDLTKGDKGAIPEPPKDNPRNK